MQKITIDRKALKAVSLFAAKKEIRYYLCGVLVESTPLETRLVATDGHTLGVHRSEAKGDNQGTFNGIIPLDIVSAILKFKSPVKNDDIPVTLTVSDNGEIRADYCGNSLLFKCVDGRFPDYRRVVPSQISGEKAFFNPDYLLRVRDASKFLGVAFSFGYNGDSPSLATIGGSMVAVLMPLRTEYLDSAIGASWAREALPGQDNVVSIAA
jgi:DNA polymerase-3 subunit beta